MQLFNLGCRCVCRCVYVSVTWHVCRSVLTNDISVQACYSLFPAAADITFLCLMDIYVLQSWHLLHLGVKFLYFKPHWNQKVNITASKTTYSKLHRDFYELFLLFVYSYSTHTSQDYPSSSAVWGHIGKQRLHRLSCGFRAADGASLSLCWQTAEAPIETDRKSQPWFTSSLWHEQSAAERGEIYSWDQVFRLYSKTASSKTLNTWRKTSISTILPTK